MQETERHHLRQEYTKRWQAILPAEQVAQQLNVTIGVTAHLVGADEQHPLAPTLYADYTPSGAAAWWMEIGQGVVTIGTSQYTRWDDIWRKTVGLLRHVGEVLGASHPMGHIRSLELTYEDLFVWRGGEECAPDQVIKLQWMPERKQKAAKEWHTGQGWVDDPQGKRILERFQVSGVVVKEGEEHHPAVAIQTTAIQGFGNQHQILGLHESFRPIYEVGKGGNSGLAVGDGLHKRTSRLLKDLITPQMARQIGLTHQDGATQ